MTPAPGVDQPAVEVEEDGSEVVLDLPESEASRGEPGADDSYSIESPDEAMALSLRRYGRAALEAVPGIWQNRKLIFKRGRNGWH